MEVIFIVIILVVLLVWRNKRVEGYRDIIPYPYIFNIFSCYSTKCNLNTSYKCYKYCGNIEEPGARTACRYRCLDMADIQADVLKWNDYTFSVIQPQLSKYSIINKNTDYVE
jgi:hypothetical protein